MAYSDLDRRNLFDAATKALGNGPAATLMELLPPAGWSDLVRQSDLLTATSGLRVEIAELRTDLKVEIAGLRTDMQSEFSRVRLEISNLQARLIATNLGAMVGLAGLVMAAAKLL